jgi:hypothetical protein
VDISPIGFLLARKLGHSSIHLRRERNQILGLQIPGTHRVLACSDYHAAVGEPFQLVRVPSGLADHVDSVAEEHDFDFGASMT